MRWSLLDFRFSSYVRKTTMGYQRIAIPIFANNNNPIKSVNKKHYACLEKQMLYVYEKSNKEIKWVKETNKDYVVLYSSSNNPMKNYDNKIYKAMLFEEEL